MPELPQPGQKATVEVAIQFQYSWHDIDALDFVEKFTHRVATIVELNKQIVERSDWRSSNCRGLFNLFLKILKLWPQGRIDQVKMDLKNFLFDKGEGNRVVRMLF
jgi:hypothetical protein